MALTDDVIQVNVPLVGVIVGIGAFASGVTVAFAVAVQPLVVFVIVKLYTPPPFATGFEIEVELKLPPPAIQV